MAADQHRDPHGDLEQDGAPTQHAFDAPTTGAPPSGLPAFDSHEGADPAFAGSSLPAAATAGDAFPASEPDAGNGASVDADAEQAERDLAAEREERLTRLFTATVMGTADERIGKVGQVYLDDQTQEPNWITARIGLFGTKEYFIPLDEAHLDGKHIVVPYTKAQVTAAPSTEIDQNLSPDEEDALYNHYRVPGRMTDAGAPPLQDASADGIEPAPGDEPTSVDTIAAALDGDDAAPRPGSAEPFAAEAGADASWARPDDSLGGDGAQAGEPFGERRSDEQSFGEESFGEQAFGEQSFGEQAQGGERFGDRQLDGRPASDQGFAPDAFGARPFDDGPSADGSRAQVDDERRADERWADEHRGGFASPQAQRDDPQAGGEHSSWAERQMGSWSIADEASDADDSGTDDERRPDEFSSFRRPPQ